MAPLFNNAAKVAKVLFLLIMKINVPSCTRWPSAQHWSLNVSVWSHLLMRLARLQMIQEAGMFSVMRGMRFKKWGHFREGGDWVFWRGVGVDGSGISQTEAAVFTRSEAQVYSCVQSGWHAHRQVPCVVLAAWWTAVCRSVCRLSWVLAAAFSDLTRGCVAGLGQARRGGQLQEGAQANCIHAHRSHCGAFKLVICRFRPRRSR